MNLIKIKENLINKEKKNNIRIENKRKMVLLQLNNIIPELCKAYKSIRYIILHGSIINNNFRENSDLDIFLQNIPVEVYWDVLRFLNRKIDIEVDLITQDDDPALITLVKKTGKTIYAR